MSRQVCSSGLIVGPSHKTRFTGEEIPSVTVDRLKKNNKEIIYIQGECTKIYSLEIYHKTLICLAK